MEFQKTVSFGRARQHLQAEFCDLKDKIGKVGVLVPDFVGIQRIGLTLGTQKSSRQKKTALYKLTISLPDFVVFESDRRRYHPPFY